MNHALAGNFGTAFWVALLTTGLGSFMNRYVANNPSATDAAAQSSALSTLAWIGVVCTLGTLFVALMLRSAAGKPVQKHEPSPSSGD